MLALSITTYAQNFSRLIDTPSPEWAQGNIVLNDGRELTGLIKYNHKYDLVAYEKGDQSKTFTPRQVAGFEFYDETLRRTRYFYSMPFEDARRSVVMPLFFEVILDMGPFAVVSKTTPLKISKKQSTTPVMFNPVVGSFSGGKFYSKQITTSHSETIFLMSKQGVIKPYLEITEKDLGRKTSSKIKVSSRILDKQLLQEFTGSLYPSLEKYANEQGLDLKSKQGFLQALEHFKDQSSQLTKK